VTNEQLSVLLFQIMRQINQQAGHIEAALRARGFADGDAATTTLELRGLAESLSATNTRLLP
jgi:hypothetical protein